MKVLVKITKEILERSHKCMSDYSENCAIALVVREIFESASVSRHSIRWCRGLRTALPEKATVFIEQFDESRPEVRLSMPEISFEIDLPEAVVKAIGVDNLYKVISNSKNLEYVNV